MKDNELISQMKILKSKMEIHILKYSDNLKDFNVKYENFNNKKIIIELDDNFKIYEIIKNRLSYC